MKPPAPPQDNASGRSAKYQLVEAKLKAPLGRYLRDARRAGNGFSTIAFDLTTRTGVALTHEVVRRWVRNAEWEAGEDPSVLPGHEHHSLTSFEEPAA